MIDLHAHVGVPAADAFAATALGFESHRRAVARRYQNPVTADYMAAIGPVWDRQLADRDERLAFMDRAGIAVQVLSVNPGQYYHWTDEIAAAELTEIVNLQIAAEVAAAPERFLGFATVSLQHPDLVVEQVQRAVRVHRLVGVQISTNAAGRDLADAIFEPFWTAVEELDVAVFVHPLGCPELTDRLAPSYLNNVVGQPLETTIALSRMIFAGVFDRHPGLRICAAHGGGYLPHYLGRGERAYAVRPDSQTMARTPGEYLRGMWFDSVVHSPRVLRDLADTVGADRVVVGTDYPFDMGEDDPALLIDESGLSGDTVVAIRYRNAISLLGSHVDRLPATVLPPRVVG